MQAILANPLAITVAILAVAVAVLLILLVILHLKLRRFLVATGADTLGDSIQALSEDLAEIKEFRGELETYLESVEKRLKKSVQAVHTVRFNPFKGNGGGGNQSFATAFMSEEGDGVVVSSLYSREHVSVFAKPIKKHSSEYELSDEEREAIASAKEALK